MTEENTSKDTLLRQAYGKATQDLRDAHRDDFNEFYAKRAAELGVDWSPRLTPEQKAAQEIAALLNKFPGLALEVIETGMVVPEPENSALSAVPDAEVAEVQ